MTAIAEPRTAAPLAPSATRARERSRLLVATAGEPDSRGALRTAAALTQRDDAEVMALGVAMPFPNRLGSFASMKSPVMIDDERRCAVLSRIQRSTQRLPAAAEWTKQAAVGMPAETINEVAASWRASMIVLGIGRHTRLDRVFGSETAVAVMRRARIPVLAVPPSTRQLPRHVLVAMDFT